MNWKHWPYWVKVFGVGLLLPLIVLLIGYFTGTIQKAVSLVRGPQIFQGLISENLFNCAYGESGLLCEISAYLLTSCLTFAIVGLIIGYLYGKFKNRNKTSVNGNIS
ncbi:MAG: hypothetical protein UX39_C0005G0013 [Candidatus Magasanikbacteria bacterium GW2011_GWA2_46_17]|uniref:Uncharacterized protein n=1 Tax=Candidatus Magasanikbacteria bacterium GW2011_GWA2_46_17 TaxID=1619042 RepID=A0A0G1S184_9BACT|nr:MAG: hypothetical protein UX39_C0005G0013 [Candidatus Magasanikbacteria bacterium GW2011_GWA2_46_17]